ncbi:MAG: ferritin-like domain-containing protein [Flavobacteriales bacterium]
MLNTLITINNDRIEGYQTALKQTEEFDLKALFEQFISTSHKCKQELVREVNTMGGKPAGGTMISGKFFRAWMDLKAAITGKDRKAILNSCEYGEDKAKETYDKVLENESDYLTTEQYLMISVQRSLLKVNHDDVKALRDALVDA